MTIAVAKAIEATLGGVLWVDKRDGIDCVGSFICIRVRFEVTHPLI